MEHLTDLLYSVTSFSITVMGHAKHALRKVAIARGLKFYRNQLVHEGLPLAIPLHACMGLC